MYLHRPLLASDVLGLNQEVVSHEGLFTMFLTLDCIHIVLNRQPLFLLYFPSVLHNFQCGRNDLGVTYYYILSGPFCVLYKITKHMQQHLYDGRDRLTWNFTHEYWATNHINFEHNKCHSIHLPFPLKSSKNVGVMYGIIIVAWLYLM